MERINKVEIGGSQYIMSGLPPLLRGGVKLFFKPDLYIGIRRLEHYRKETPGRERPGFWRGLKGNLLDPEYDVIA